MLDRRKIEKSSLSDNDARKSETFRPIIMKYIEVHDDRRPRPSTRNAHTGSAWRTCPRTRIPTCKQEDSLTRSVICYSDDDWNDDPSDLYACGSFLGGEDRGRRSCHGRCRLNASAHDDCILLHGNDRNRFDSPHFHQTRRKETRRGAGGSWKLCDTILHCRNNHHATGRLLRASNADAFRCQPEHAAVCDAVCNLHICRQHLQHHAILPVRCHARCRTSDMVCHDPSRRSGNQHDS